MTIFSILVALKIFFGKKFEEILKRKMLQFGKKDAKMNA